MDSREEPKPVAEPALGRDRLALAVVGTLLAAASAGACGAEPQSAEVVPKSSGAKPEPPAKPVAEPAPPLTSAQPSGDSPAPPKPLRDVAGPWTEEHATRLLPQTLEFVELATFLRAHQATRLVRELQRVHFGMPRDDARKLAPTISRALDPDELPKGISAELRQKPVRVLFVYVPKADVASLTKTLTKLGRGGNSNQAAVYADASGSKRIEVWNNAGAPGYVRVEIQPRTTVDALVGRIGRFGFEPPGGLLGASREAVEAHFGAALARRCETCAPHSVRLPLVGVVDVIPEVGLSWNDDDNHVESFRFVLPAVSGEHNQANFKSLAKAWELQPTTVGFGEFIGSRRVVQRSPRVDLQAISAGRSQHGLSFHVRPAE